MKNKVIIPTILFIIVLAFSFFAFSGEGSKKQSPEIAQQEARETQPESQIVLFYGDGCPHCAIVDKYLEENNIAKQINFSHKEVYLNRNNAKELEAKAKVCGMPTDSIGVPFLWDGEKCYVGDQDIIDFFKQKINTK